ncbi:MAG: Abi family protein [Fluviicola sp.]
MEAEKPKYKEKKPAKRPDELIVKLREKNLEISQEDEIPLKNYIRSIGYYRLSGYFKPFKTDGRFNDGTNYKHIIDLYTFDKELRLMSLHALKTIEINLKAALSDTLSISYDSDWYVQPKLFDSTRKKEAMVNDYQCVDGNVEVVPVKKDINLYRGLLEGIQENVDRNKGKEYLVHLREKYDKMEAVPSWMMMQCISFGKLSKLFGLLKPSERRGVSRLFGAANADAFPSWLESFVVLRNLSAHHERAWNWKFPGGLSFPSREKHRFVTMLYGVENHPENKHILYYYGVSACILKVLSKIAPDEAINFKNEFWSKVDKYGVDVSEMGFPDTFDSYDIWKREA